MKHDELVSEHPHRISIDGAIYEVLVYGSERKDGTWSGSLQFRDVKTKKTLTTGQETSQPDRKALEYWATGVEDVYLEGALRRAH
jgi:hypothetical protein